MYRIQVRQAINMNEIREKIIIPYIKEISVKTQDTMDYIANNYEQYPEAKLMFKTGERRANKKRDELFERLSSERNAMKEYRQKQELQKMKDKESVLQKSRQRVKEIREEIMRELHGPSKEDIEEIIPEVESIDESDKNQKYTLYTPTETTGFDLKRSNMLPKYNPDIKFISFDSDGQKQRNPPVVKELFKQNNINQFPIVSSLFKELGSLQLDFFPQFSSIDTTKPTLYYADPILAKISSKTEVILAPRPPPMEYNLKLKTIIFTKTHLYSCFNNTVIDHSENNPLMTKNYNLLELSENDINSILMRRLVISQNLKHKDTIIKPFDPKLLTPDPIVKEESINNTINGYEESENDREANRIIKQLMEGGNKDEIEEEININVKDKKKKEKPAVIMGRASVIQPEADVVAEDKEKENYLTVYL